MNYALLVFHPHEQFHRRDNATIAAGKTYGEARRTSGVVVTAAGLWPLQSATLVFLVVGVRPLFAYS